MPAILVITTVPRRKEAVHLARFLIRKKLAACVSFKEGFTSLYRWKGRLERAEEVLVLVKTEKRLYPRVEKVIGENHPYETPEILSVPVTRGAAKYLSWLGRSVMSVLIAALCVCAAAPAFAGEAGISADELRQLQIRKVPLILFDARSKADYDQSHIEGAVLPIPESYYEEMKKFRAQLIQAPPDFDAALLRATTSIPRETRIVTYCNVHCSAAELLAKQLKSLGFENVSFMKEGIQAWAAKGYPVKN
jgi:periplasmic divalent cation tolerance protein